MVRIRCCSLLQDAEILEIKPTKEILKQKEFTDRAFLLHLHKCSNTKSGVHQALEIIALDIDGHYHHVNRIKPKNIDKYLRSASVIDRPKKLPGGLVAYRGKFYLFYSEYGIRKKCFENLSSLSLGRFETDIEKELKFFKQPKNLLVTSPGCP